MSRDGGWELPLRRGSQAGTEGTSPSKPVAPAGLERTVVAPVPGISEDGLGGYRFGHHIGQSGDVYEAEHPRFQGRLALKMFRRAAGVDTAAVDEFSREAGRVSILRHPHIAQVMEAGALRDGTPFVSMELLTGETLDELLNGRGALPAAELLSLVRGIASALTAAHTAGIVHREVRPDNIFVVSLAGYEQGFVKVLDFGVSRLTAAERAAGRGTGIRAPSYQAPEQVAGRLEDVTPAADQFALGALAYRLLSGSDPFVAHARPRGLERVGAGKAGLVAALARRAPAVDAVVSKAMSRHPGERFESVALFFRAFEEALAGSALISTPVPVAGSRESSAPKPAPQPEAPTLGAAASEAHSGPRSTLFGPGPGPGVPSALRDLPTREVPVHEVLNEVTSGNATPLPTAPPALTASPRPPLRPASIRPLASDRSGQRSHPGAEPEGVTLTQQFFADGERQESERYVNSYRNPETFSEPAHDFDSFDRVPKRRSPLFLVVLIVFAGGTAAAWWAGWRPPQTWQQSNTWKALRLPLIPPATTGPLSHPPEPVPSPSAPAAPDGVPSEPAAGAAPAARTESPVGTAGEAPVAASPSPAPTAPAPSASPPAAPPVPSAARSSSSSARSRSSTRRTSALDGFVWSRAEKAYVPVETVAPAPPTTPPAAPAPTSAAPDDPLPLPP